ncbi:MAG: sensor histidine kinase, partial [Betaproteobacteria bacterium]
MPDQPRARTAAFDPCHPALALRVVLLVQAVLAVVALAGAGDAAQWWQRQSVMAFAGAAAALSWLVAACALRPRRAAAAPGRRGAVGVARGAGAALRPGAG